MTREKFLVIAVVFLLVLNGVVISFMVFKQPAPPKPLFELITERLHFDDKQKEEFYALRAQHRHSMDSLDLIFEQTVHSYLKLLTVNQPDSSGQINLENRLAEIERFKARETLRHFQRVKAICTSDQQPEFERIVPELVRVLLPPKNNFPPHRR